MVREIAANVAVGLDEEGNEIWVGMRETALPGETPAQAAARIYRLAVEKAASGYGRDTRYDEIVEALGWGKRGARIQIVRSFDPEEVG